MKPSYSFLLIVGIIFSSKSFAVMAPWYWVGFPVQLNYDYPGNPKQLIGAHYTFIFDTYHYDNGKKYPAGRIMQSNSSVLYWYVALMPQSKGLRAATNARAVAFIEPEPGLLHMLQLPKETSSIAIVGIGTDESWQKIWKADRERMRAEFQELLEGKKKPRRKWLVS